MTVAVQAALVAGIIVIQMAMPEKLGEFQLVRTLYMAPPPPPPAPAAPEAPQPVRHETPKAVVSQRSIAPTQAVQQPVEQPRIVAPTAIPNDIARIVEAGAPAAPGGAPHGVPGGVLGGTAGGSLGGLLGGESVAQVPPPPPTGPVRVGGNVKQPKLVHMEQPHYPPEAKRSHIEGVVMVEATLTADGSVEQVKVISGPPELTQAAADAVSHWKYEPTYLNGKAVPVILSARITFSLANSEK